VAEAHVLWVIVVAERKRMTAVEPAKLRATAIIALAEFDQFNLLMLFSMYSFMFTAVLLCATPLRDPCSSLYAQYPSVNSALCFRVSEHVFDPSIRNEP
jgi:hypothetical protein